MIRHNAAPIARQGLRRTRRTREAIRTGLAAGAAPPIGGTIRFAPPRDERLRLSSLAFRRIRYDDEPHAIPHDIHERGLASRPPIRPLVQIRQPRMKREAVTLDVGVVRICQRLHRAHQVTSPFSPSASSIAASIGCASRHRASRDSRSRTAPRAIEYGVGTSSAANSLAAIRVAAARP